MRRGRSLGLVLGVLGLWAGPAFGAEKPSAVQVCFNGLEEHPLFVDRPQRNYRPFGEGLYLLDLDIKLNGAAPARLTRSGPSCLRAWVQPTLLKTIEVDFDRTDTNLEPISKSLTLKLKADLWHDAGTVGAKQAPFAHLSTQLPGKLEVLRQEDKGQVLVEDPSKLSRGSYAFKYTPPEPPKVPCPINVVVEATGTITEESKPEQLKALVENYKARIAPDVLASQHETCTSTEVVELHLEISDGVYHNPRSPKLIKTAKKVDEPTYTLKVDGQARPYKSGEVVQVGYGQSLTLE